MPISATNSPDRNYTDLIGSGSNKTEKRAIFTTQYLKIIRIQASSMRIFSH